MNNPGYNSDEQFQGMSLTSTKYLGVGLMVASLLPLSHGAKQYSAQKTFVSESSQRVATVVGLAGVEPARGQKKTNSVYSVVEFVDDAGLTRTARSNVGSYPAPHAIGDVIDIRFHHVNKDDVRIDSFTGMWFESAFYLVPGLITLLGGFAMFRKSRKA